MGFLDYSTQLALVAVLGSVFFGWMIAGVNSSMNILIAYMEWCGSPGRFKCENTEYSYQVDLFTGFVGGVLSIGAGAGAYFGGQFAGHGRRKMLLLGSAIGMIASTICAAAPGSSLAGFLFLVFGRALGGFAVGIIAVLTPMYIAESVPPEKRGQMGIMHQLCITTGIFLGVIIGLGFSTSKDGSDYIELTGFDNWFWRFMLALPILPLALQFILLTFVYTKEPPCQDVADGNNESAEESLKLIVGEEKVKEILAELIKKDIENKQAETLTVYGAFKYAYYRPAIAIGCILALMQQTTGINILMSASDTIFRAANIKNGGVTAASGGLTILNVLMTFVAIALIERVGRRVLLLGGWIGQTLTILVALIVSLCPKKEIQNTAGDTIYEYHEWQGGVIVAAFYLFIVFFAVGAGPVVWLYLSEIYPMEIRSSAMGLGTSLNWMFSFLMIFIGMILKSGPVFYGILFVCNALGAVFVAIYVVETRGQPTGEIPGLYDESKKPQRNQKEVNAL